MKIRLGRLREVICEVSANFPGGPTRNVLSPATNTREQIGSLAGNVPLDTVDDYEGMPDHLFDPEVDPEDCLGPVPPDAEEPYVGQDPFVRDAFILPTSSTRR